MIVDFRLQIVDCEMDRQRAEGMTTIRLNIEDCRLNICGVSSFLFVGTDIA